MVSAVNLPPDPGGSIGTGNLPQSHSYADRLTTIIKFDQRLQRNILEIILEKDSDDVQIDVNENNAWRLFETLGIDIQNELEGHQVKYDKISVWLKQGVDLDKFCRDEKIRVSQGVKTSFIKPAGRKDVTVTVVGLDFNTPDTFVLEYLKNFGRIVNNSVIYGKFSDGPFKNKFNGERKYQIDFSEKRMPMGTYHIIDGERVKIFYRGNRKTCARCHEFAEVCPGGGSAKDCEDASGPKVALITHMKNLWSKLNFIPANFEVEDEVPIYTADSFPPIVDKGTQRKTDSEKFTGISINNLPLKATEKEILSLLSSMVSDLPNQIKIEDIKFNKKDKNQNITLEPLPSTSVMKLFECLDFPQTKKKHLGVPLYCKPIRNLTPSKLQLSDGSKGECEPQP